MPVCLDFKNGKLYPNDRPGLGVELDMKQLKQIAEITQPVTASAPRLTSVPTARSPTGKRALQQRQTAASSRAEPGNSRAFPALRAGNHCSPTITWYGLARFRACRHLPDVPQANRMLASSAHHPILIMFSSCLISERFSSPRLTCVCDTCRDKHMEE